MYYSEQQDHCRESTGSYWTQPRSRTVGALQTYTNWTDQDLAGHSSSNFPFILDPQPQHHQQHHMGQYQLQEARDREWTASQRASREYERGFLREGWQRRWESCSPVRYNVRDASSKRHDSSYRELEAWAARYSHSLPRRRRIEAEMRGASQSFVDSSRDAEQDNRSRMDPRVAALQSNASVKETELWTKAGRQQGSIHHPAQSLSADTGLLLNLKDQSSSQRRVFSQPPGYIAPPPYSSPQKSLPSGEQDVKHHGGPCNVWTKQGVLENDGKEKTENLTKSDGNHHTFPMMEGLKHLGKETEALQESTTMSGQETEIQFEGMLSLQFPQLLYPTSHQSEEPSPKVIEGRKFRLNKKRGGLTIFCLVSRIAETSENLSSPVSNLQTLLKSADVRSSSPDQTRKLADEVDFIAPSLREQSGGSTETPSTTAQRATAVEGLVEEQPEDLSSNKANTDVDPKQEHDPDGQLGRQAPHSEPSSLVKYPLWKEPSFFIKSETETSSTCPTVENEEDEPDVLDCQAVSTQVASNDPEGETLEIEEATELEDCTCESLVDTSCVVVKAELISAPKKEHVQYFDSPAPSEHGPPDMQMTAAADGVQSSSPLNQELRKDQCAETEAIKSTEWPEFNVDAKQKQILEDGNETSIPGTSTSSAPERESLEERAQRILGISVGGCFPEQQPDDDDDTLPAVTDDVSEPPPALDLNSGDAAEEILGEATVEEESQVQLDDAQTEDSVCSVERDHVPKEADDGSAEVLAVHREQLSSVPEKNNNDLQCDLSIGLLPEDPEDTYCESERNSPPPEIPTAAPQLPQGSGPTDLSSSLLSSSLDNESPGGYSEEGLDPGLVTCSTPENPTHDCSPSSEATSQQPALPPPTTGTVQTDLQDSSASSHTNHSDDNACPIQSPLHVTHENSGVSTLEDQDEEGESLQERNLNGLAKDEAEDAASQQRFDTFVNGGCTEEVDVAPDERAEESDASQRDQITEEILEMSQANVNEVNISHQQQGCFGVEEESLKCERESEESEDISGEQIYTFHTEEQVLLQPQTLTQSYDDQRNKSQQSQEVQRPEGPVEQSASQEKTETEDQIFHKQQNNDQEDEACALEPCIIDYSQNGASKDSSAQLEQPKPKEKAGDPRSNDQMKNLTNTELETISSPYPTLPSETDAPLSELLSQDTDTKTNPKEIFSGAGPPAGTTGSDPYQHSPHTEETLKLSSSHFPDSPTSALPLPSVECEGFDTEPMQCLLGEQSQYPKSLRDAVSRIRKHTAPDSENEEEEVSEPWDPESAGEDTNCPLWAQQMHCEWRGDSGVVEQREAWTQEGGEDSEAVEDVELHEHAAEDTVSCSSSSSSHGSEDTVVIAADEEEEVESVTSSCVSAAATHGGDAEEEQCCPREVKDESAADREGERNDQSNE